ncbi:MAG: hypothetical protein RJA98_1793 [Pseudomonadota bacterium]|jgi:adhesin transport system membrane fusion protein
MSAAVQTRPLPSVDPDSDRGPRRIVMAMVAVMLTFVVVALVWGAFAQLDVAVHARGAVTPPRRVQEVQSLEGGIVREMLVAEGQKVKKGQVLVRLDTAQYAASLGESQQNRLAALAGRARVDALLGGGTPQFDPLVQQQAPELVAKEMTLWRDAQRTQLAGVSAAREAAERRRGELAEGVARIASLEDAAKVSEESFTIEEKLFREGAGARADYLSAKQRLLSVRTELDSLRKSLPRLKAGVAEAQAAASEVEARTRSQWGTQRAEFDARANALASTERGQQDRVDRRDIASPVDGVVNRIKVPTVGGVAPPGSMIMEIVPDDADIVFTVRTKPADIGFIRIGQDANINVLAYDAATYGRIGAKVTRVGADALVDERGEAYFEVQLASDKGQLLSHGKVLPITPGMPVDVGVLTGQRSVLQYLFKPVLRGVQGALQER